MLSEVFTPDGREETRVNLHSPDKENPVVRPIEGMWFRVNPCEINQELFQKEREDERQEETRQLILKAFQKVEEYPRKYKKPFETMSPKKKWDWKTEKELLKIAKILGDHNANWVEQALQWAWRIQNGETWEDLCNEPDTETWYRLVIGDDDFVWVVGGKKGSRAKEPSSAIFKFAPSTKFYCDTVPLVVRYI